MIQNLCDDIAQDLEEVGLDYTGIAGSGIVGISTLKSDIAKLSTADFYALSHPSNKHLPERLINMQLLCMETVEDCILIFQGYEMLTGNFIVEGIPLYIDPTCFSIGLKRINTHMFRTGEFEDEYDSGQLAELRTITESVLRQLGTQLSQLRRHADEIQAKHSQVSIGLSDLNRTIQRARSAFRP